MIVPKQIHNPLAVTLIGEDFSFQQANLDVPVSISSREFIAGLFCIPLRVPQVTPQEFSMDFLVGSLRGKAHIRLAA